ncbi:hypothetical protein FRC12_016381 [Ceratobasidium sp. 428]|nr:hypothetical protein FRC12_016381 [Ceratobasidium sp. 428]
MLRTEEFWVCVLNYIQANLRSFRPGLSTLEEVKQVRTRSDIAYSCCPDPSLTTEVFTAQLEELETEVVRAKQVHQCSFQKCLRFGKGAKVTCKRGAPWELSEGNSVDQNGTYQTKHSNKFINQYCPIISQVLKCNQDIRLLLHGDETKQIAWYISKYMTKTEGRTHNIASLLANKLTHHFNENPGTKDYLRRQQDLLSRATNILNREQELSAPLAALFILGLPDVYRSHHPKNIFWARKKARGRQKAPGKTRPQMPTPRPD